VIIGSVRFTLVPLGSIDLLPVCYQRRVILNNTECKTTQVDLKDDKIRGLSMRVFPNRKSFYLFYRTASGVQRRPKLGDFPTLSVSQARDLAKDWLHRVSQGEDPSKDRATKRAGMTVKQFSTVYLWRHARKKKSFKEDRRQINKYIRPNMGSEKIEDISREDIKALHNKMKKSPVQANRTLSLLSKMMNFAEEIGERKNNTNPCQHIAHNKEKKRTRYCSKEEAVAVFERLYHYSQLHPGQCAMMWLLIYTGARPSEIARCRPEDVHSVGLVLEEHKTDSTGRPRVIKLPKQARALIQGLPPTKNGTLTGVKSAKSLWEKIRRDTGISDLRIYDMRHTFASVGLTHSDLNLEKIKDLLGHTTVATTERYAHLMNDGAQDAVDRIGDAIDELGDRVRVVN
jgi:integrase